MVGNFKHNADVDEGAKTIDKVRRVLAIRSDAHADNTFEGCSTVGDLLGRTDGIDATACFHHEAFSKFTLLCSASSTFVKPRCRN